MCRALCAAFRESESPFLRWHGAKLWILSETAKHFGHKNTYLIRQMYLKPFPNTNLSIQTNEIGT